MWGEDSPIQTLGWETETMELGQNTTSPFQNGHLAPELTGEPWPECERGGAWATLIAARQLGRGSLPSQQEPEGESTHPLSSPSL